ncbi:MAG: hypothetical protein ACREFE_03320 [Limisphaerales bacterium]
MNNHFGTPEKTSSAFQFPNLMPFACWTFALSLVLAIFSSRCLYADGAHEFIRVLQAQDFVALMWSRHFAFYIFEFPLVLAIKLGVTNLAWLRLAFGLGCFLPWPIAMMCCCWISPKNFWLAVVGCAAGYLNAAFMAVGEHILAHALFWPSLFAILFARPLKLVVAVILLVSATGKLFSYESQLFLGVPLALLALWRAWREKKENRRWTWIVFLVAAALFIAGITVGLCGVLMPELQANFTGFEAGTLGILKHMGWTLTWTVVWVGLAIAVWFSETLWRIISHKAVIYFLFVLLMVWGTWPLLSPNQLDNGIQYDNRALDMLVPLALLPVALILRFRPQWVDAKRSRLVQWAAALLIAQSLWQISATLRWYRDVVWMKEILASHRGIVLLHSTVLAADKMEGRELRRDAIGGRFDWTWPCLSIALSPRPKISSLICSEVFLVPAIRRHYWQPFDPLDPKTFPDLRHYGVDYSDYISAISKSGKR